MNVYFKNGSSFVSIYDLIYPVGAYYISDIAHDCGANFGGQWTLVDERMLIGSNWGNGIGGNSWDVTLTEAQMPAHSHYLSGWHPNRESGNTTAQGGQLSAGGVGFVGNVFVYEEGGTSTWVSGTGGNGSFNIAGRYRYCFMYYRTA